MTRCETRYTYARFASSHWGPRKRFADRGSHCRLGSASQETTWHDTWPLPIPAATVHARLPFSPDPLYFSASFLPSSPTLRAQVFLSYILVGFEFRSFMSSTQGGTEINCAGKVGVNENKRTERTIAKGKSGTRPKQKRAMEGNSNSAAFTALWRGTPTPPNNRS
jgi:hypothetical protein